MKYIRKKGFNKTKRNIHESVTHESKVTGRQVGLFLCRFRNHTGNDLQVIC